MSCCACIALLDDCLIKEAVLGTSRTRLEASRYPLPIAADHCVVRHARIIVFVVCMIMILHRSDSTGRARNSHGQNINSHALGRRRAGVD